MSTTWIKSIRAVGVFGRFDFDQSFEEGINIIYGKNGAGKTTLLHILTNALSSDFERFDSLDFDSITINLSDKKIIEISKIKNRNNSRTVKVLLNKKELYPNFNYKELGDIYIDKSKFNEIIADNDFIENWKIIDKNLSRLGQEDILEKTAKNITSEETFNLKEKEKAKERIFSFLLKKELSFNTLLPIAYFPAFRTMIEAWAASSISKDTSGGRSPSKFNTEEWKSKATEQARDWFGPFIPVINFPSLIEIEDTLTAEIFRARFDVGNRDRNLLSEAFLRVFGSLSDRAQLSIEGNEVLKQIQELYLEFETSPMGIARTSIYKDLQKELAKLQTTEGALETSAIRILAIYKDVLRSSLQTQKTAFNNIESYVDSVNEFLEDIGSPQMQKSLAYNLDAPSTRHSMLGIKYDDGTFTPGLRSLSSGERQVITLLYASTRMSEPKVVLIDEPEISLHIDWQRKLISKMAEYIGNKQIIACTHSPVIAADYQEYMKEFKFIPTRTKPSHQTENPE